MSLVSYHCYHPTMYIWADSGNRTRTIITDQQILSLSCIPIPTSEHTDFKVNQLHIQLLSLELKFVSTRPRGPAWAWTKDPQIMNLVLLTNWATSPNYRIVNHLQELISHSFTPLETYKLLFSLHFCNNVIELFTLLEINSLLSITSSYLDFTYTI